MPSLRKRSGNFRTFAAVYLVVVTAIFSIIRLAEGATPHAWAAYDREVVSACIKASNLRNAKRSGDIIEFDDRIGITAVVIDGRYPQPHMNNQRGRVLCLFDKQTRTPFVSEAGLDYREKRSLNLLRKNAVGPVSTS